MVNLEKTRFRDQIYIKKVNEKNVEKNSWRAYDNVPLCQIAVNLEWKISDFATRFVKKKYLKKKKKKKWKKKVSTN